MSDTIFSARDLCDFYVAKMSRFLLLCMRRLMTVRGLFLPRDIVNKIIIFYLKMYVGPCVITRTGIGLTRELKKIVITNI